MNERQRKMREESKSKGLVEELLEREEPGKRQTTPSSSNKPSGQHFSCLQNKTCIVSLKILNRLSKDTNKG